MGDEEAVWASISARPLYGTATPIPVVPAVPADKSDREVFWATALVRKLEESRFVDAEVSANPDDSHGKDDVVVSLGQGDSIGIQVAELTSELERERRSQRERYIDKVLRCLAAQGPTSGRKLVVKCMPPTELGRRYSLPSPEEIAAVVGGFISGARNDSVCHLESATLVLQWVDEGEIYVPKSGQIGFDCAIDELPRSIQTYCGAASALAHKKATSRSPWLLVWSTSFWRDKHWLGNDVLKHMRETFQDSTFERVYFAESMDCREAFDTNLKVHRIKN